MFPEWTSSVDMLADAGIIDYDAPAHIMGLPSRYIGSPQYPVYNIPPLKIQPLSKDKYQSTLPDKQVVTNPLWKKLLFGAIAAVGLLWGVSKVRNAPALLKNTAANISTFFKNLFKKKP